MLYAKRETKAVLSRVEDRKMCDNWLSNQELFQMTGIVKRLIIKKWATAAWEFRGEMNQ